MGRIVDLCGEIAAAAEEGPEGLVLPPVGAHVLEASVLGGGRAEARATAAGLELRVAPSDRRSIDTVVVLRLDRPASTIAAI